MEASRLCFAVTRARGDSRISSDAVSPAGHVHVAAWPEAGVRAEVSVRAGTLLRPGSVARLTVGSEKFTLFTRDAGAFVEDPIDELKLLEAMKKGSEMTFAAKSEAGDAVAETFSLAGFAAALGDVTRGCP